MTWYWFNRAVTGLQLNLTHRLMTWRRFSILIFLYLNLFYVLGKHRPSQRKRFEVRFCNSSDFVWKHSFDFILDGERKKRKKRKIMFPRSHDIILQAIRLISAKNLITIKRCMQRAVESDVSIPVNCLTMRSAFRWEPCRLRIADRRVCRGISIFLNNIPTAPEI